jgi:hypothetical protein
MNANHSHPVAFLRWERALAAVVAVLVIAAAFAFDGTLAAIAAVAVVVFFLLLPSFNF